MTEQERLFVLCYVRTWNASEAAKEAGYAPRSRGTTGYRLLKKAEIQQEISRVVAECHRQAEWSAEEAIKLRTLIARARIQDFADVIFAQDPKQTLRELGDLGHCVRAIDVGRAKITTSTTTNGKTAVKVDTRTDRVKLILHDKHHAIDELEYARRLEPHRGAPPLDFSDWTPEELDTLEGILRAVKARREAKPPQIELQATDYQEVSGRLGGVEKK